MRVVTQADVRALVEERLVRVLPMTLEVVVLCRGPVPRGVWTWLWGRIGRWLARKAGFVVVW